MFRQIRVDFRDLRVAIPKKVTDNKRWMYVFTYGIEPGNNRSTNVKRLHVSEEFGIRAYVEKWNHKENGIIYNNPQWITDFRKSLSAYLGVIVRSGDVSYSEQGLQGSNYVHMDIAPRIAKLLLQ